MENSSISKPSQLSPELWPANAFFLPYTLLALGGFVAIGIVAALLLVTFGASRLGLHLGGIDPTHLKPAQTAALFILQDLVYLPVVALIISVTPFLAKRTLQQLGIGIPRIRDLRNGLFGAGAAWLSVALVTFLWDFATKKQHQQTELALFLHLNLMQSIISAITAVIIAPVAEEIAFRFFLFNALLRYVQSIVDTIATRTSAMRPSAATRRNIAAGLAIVINGLLFGIAHGQLDVVPALATCGIVLATVYYRTGSLWTNIIAHALFNGVTTVALLIFHYEG